MTVFIDTGIFVALHNADDNLHTKSQELKTNALKGEYGKIFTSDYIIDEAITTALMRTKNHNLAMDLGKFIIESPRITKLWITETTFKKAWQKINTLKNKPISFTDATSITLIETNKIQQIMSFDSDFHPHRFLSKRMNCGPDNGTRFVSLGLPQGSPSMLVAAPRERQCAATHNRSRPTRLVGEAAAAFVTRWSCEAPWQLPNLWRGPWPRRPCPSPWPWLRS